MSADAPTQLDLDAIRKRYTADLPSAWENASAHRRVLYELGKDSRRVVPQLLEEAERLRAKVDRLMGVLEPYTREYPKECNKRVAAENERDAALAVVRDHLPVAPSVVSDAAGLGDRIATLSARLAAVGFPACMCHPGDDDSERCLPSPQDWRAEIERAALSSTTLTATPSATREAVEAVIFEADDECVLEVHEVRSLASRLLARFTITPKETSDE